MFGVMMMRMTQVISQKCPERPRDSVSLSNTNMRARRGRQNKRTTKCEQSSQESIQNGPEKKGSLH